MKGFSNFFHESTTVSVQGADTDQPHNIQYLAHYLHDNILHSVPDYKNATHTGTNPIDIDGLDTNNRKGIINFYTKGITQVDKVLAAIKYFLGNINVKFGQPKHDKSNLFTNEDVIRIPILGMQPTNPPPELNIANANAEILFHQILNYPSTLNINMDSINARELLMKLGYVNDLTINQNIRNSQKGKNWLDMRLNAEQIKRYVQELEKIAKWAIDNDYDTIQLS